MNGPHFFSLGCKLSNKTNCSPFGARLLGQMVPQPARCLYQAPFGYPGSHATFGQQFTAWMTRARRAIVLEDEYFVWNQSRSAILLD